jgi:AcrR family transcriptional regulator
MPKKRVPGSEPVATSRRDLAVARVLDPARERAEIRVQRFLDAATELMHESPGNDFTVQEVVERSGQSLRSFYQYFDGKHELLLALYEESVRVTAAHLQTVIDAEPDPLERLHLLVVEYYRMCRPGPKGRSSSEPTPALVEFAQQLLIDHPKEARRAFTPLIEMVESLLDDATAAGEIQSTLTQRRLTGVILQAIMYNAFATTISGQQQSESGAEALWDLVLHGLGASLSA